MVEMEINAQTAILLAVILVAFVFALRRAARVFGGKEGCHGEGGSSRRKNAKPIVVEDTDESHYPYCVELTVGGMTCERCQAVVENSINAIPGMWARVDLAARRAVVLGKEPIDRTKVETVIEKAGYYVIEEAQ